MPRYHDETIKFLQLLGNGEALDNLHDAVNLRTLMDLGYNRMIERLRLPARPVLVSERGDHRYDMTKLLLAL